MEGHVDIIKFLLTFDNDPNIQTSEGFTHIFVAAFKGHIDVLKLLAPLTKNPNQGTFGEIGHTPIQIAQKFGNHEFARLLQIFINTGHF